MNTATIPPAVRATLWSYDVDAMNIVRDKERIITNVLNHGTKEATDWLRIVYTLDDIKHVTAHPRPGEWNKKSLNFWATVFSVTPRIRTRF